MKEKKKVERDKWKSNSTKEKPKSGTPKRERKKQQQQQGAAWRSSSKVQQQGAAARGGEDGGRDLTEPIVCVVIRDFAILVEEVMELGCGELVLEIAGSSG